MTFAVLLFALVLSLGISQGVKELDDSPHSNKCSVDYCNSEYTSMFQSRLNKSSKESFDMQFSANSFLQRAAERSEKAFTMQQEIPIIMINTFDHRRHFAVPGVRGMHFTNIGAGKTWGGFKTKVKLVQEWLQPRLVDDPDGLVVVLDSDVLYGGCSEKELLSRYKAITSASGGASVVMGAELGQWPQSLNEPGRYASFQSRRKAVQQAFSLSDDSYGQYANLTLCQERMHLSPCSGPPVYQFLNAGFIMGPAKGIHKMYAGMLELPDSKTGTGLKMNFADGGWDDQAAAAEYMFSHADDITLDYTGTLSFELAMFNDPMKEGLLFAKDGKWHNNATGLVQCFVHNNVPDGSYSQRFFPQMLAQFSDVEYIGDMTVDTPMSQTNGQ